MSATKEDEFIPDRYIPIIEILLCVAGSIANILCILVLNSKKMKSPIDFLLTSTIGNDTLGLILKIIYRILQISTAGCPSEEMMYVQEIFLITSAMCFGFNSWLVAAAAIFRYKVMTNKAVKSPYTYRTAKKAMAIAIFFAVLNFLPFLLRIDIRVRSVYVNGKELTCYYHWFTDNIITEWTYAWCIFTLCLTSMSLTAIFCALLIYELVCSKQGDGRKSTSFASSSKKNKSIARQITVSLVFISISSALCEVPFVYHPLYRLATGSQIPWYLDETAREFQTLYTTFNSCCSIIGLSMSSSFRKQLKRQLRLGKSASSESAVTVISDTRFAQSPVHSAVHSLVHSPEHSSVHSPVTSLDRTDVENLDNNNAKSSDVIDVKSSNTTHVQSSDVPHVKSLNIEVRGW